MHDLIAIYNLLCREYGPQHWWPTISRTKKQKKFEICLGAILTQNTNWQNVEKAIYNLYQAKQLTPQRILRTTDYELRTKIKSSGYYKVKARKLKVFSQMIQDDFSGNLDQLFKLPLAKARQKLLNTWGIGPETADSMLLYAGNKPIFVIDAYTKRLAKCLGIRNLDYHYLQNYFLQNLPKSVKIYQEFHALIVRLAKECCRTRPLCKTCPIKLKTN